MIRYFISNIQDIDDMLGPEPCLSPRKAEPGSGRKSSAESSISTVTTEQLSLSSDSTVEEVPVAVVKVHESGAHRAEVSC